MSLIVDRDLEHSLLLDTSVVTSGNSDYGSDLDTDGEQVVSKLLSGGGESVKESVLESIVKDDNRKYVLYIPNQAGKEIRSHQQAVGEDGNDLSSTQTTHLSLPQAVVPNGQTESPVVQGQADEPDTRSPIERFRQAPKKALSVSDIVSPAWCELQYWYVLTKTKYGRKRTTPAMKQGTKVHKVLQSEVHTVVPVKVTTKEDGWGLRIWNIVQGLRTLRTTGLTREMEVWGVLHGQVIIGCIDEISYHCTDPMLEATLDKSRLPLKLKDQKKITDMFSSQSGASASRTPSRPVRKVYLTDVKTRGTRFLPQAVALRPTQMQLMLYHRLFVEMATNLVPADVIFDRYKLDAKSPFSDAFIAAITSLADSFIPAGDGSAEENSHPDSLSELLSHNSLTELWCLMITEFQRTIPSAEAVGQVLQAEFRSQQDGTVLGNSAFLYDDEVHRAYVDDGMKWWKGEREARGVEIEEAFKCSTCDFAEDCGWRAERAAKHAVATMRSRVKSLAKVRKIEG